MNDILDAEFDTMITQAMDELPQEYIKNLNNVVITFADEPTAQQLQKQGVRSGQLLLGLYEGIPQTSRLSSSYSGILPDKITLFKDALQLLSTDQNDLQQRIYHTLWHEVAHYYGLDHPAIHALE